MKLSLVAVLLLACAKETPAIIVWPANTIPPDDVDRQHHDGLKTDIGRACQHMRLLGCSDGFPDAKTGSTCFETATHSMALLGVTADTGCVLASVSIEAIRMCGTKEQIRFTCK